MCVCVCVCVSDDDSREGPGGGWAEGNEAGSNPPHGDSCVTCLPSMGLAQCFTNQENP
jgi:hypothetical protein